MSDFAFARMKWDGGCLDIVATRVATMKRSDIMHMNPHLTIEDFPPVGTHVWFEYFETDGMKEC